MKRPSDEYMHNKTWEQKARENPLYGVMSHEEFIESGADPTAKELDTFYARGSEMVSVWISPWLTETRTTNDMRILEFGCGMGRLTNAMAKIHPPENVYGIDISGTMISHAIKNTLDACQYSVIEESGSFPYEDNQFDRIYSYAVFQHISEKRVVESSIREIGRILKPNGHVKLNFEMAFPAPFEGLPRRDTYAFNQSYLLYGWKRIAGFPVWGLKRKRANNWVGIRLGYKQVITSLSKSGIEVYGLIREPSQKRQMWFLGRKRAN